MSSVNLYDVLEVEPDCTIQDIKDSYKKLVLKYHPDRPNGDSDMFELITQAYTTLSNSKRRQEYDQYYSISKQSELDHISLKKQSQNYYKYNKNSKSKEECKKEFEQEFNKKNIPITPITEKEYRKKLKDLETTREQEDIENIHEKIFDDGRFDISKFNAAYDAVHGSSASYDIIPHTGNPSAYNIMYGSNFSSTNINNPDDLDDLDNFTVDYAPINISNKSNKLTKEEIDNLKGASYVRNYKKPIKQEKIKKMIEKRESYDENYNDHKTDDYGGYGIFDKIGISKEEINDLYQEDIKSKYKKLLEDRR
jgi:curved DNA-binding protein CbpA